MTTCTSTKGREAKQEEEEPKRSNMKGVSWSRFIVSIITYIIHDYPILSYILYLYSVQCAIHGSLPTLVVGISCTFQPMGWQWVVLLEVFVSKMIERAQFNLMYKYTLRLREGTYSRCRHLSTRKHKRCMLVVICLKELVFWKVCFHQIA